MFYIEMDVRTLQECMICMLNMMVSDTIKLLRITWVSPKTFNIEPVDRKIFPSLLLPPYYPMETSADGIDFLITPTVLCNPSFDSSKTCFYQAASWLLPFAVPLNDYWCFVLFGRLCMVSSLSGLSFDTRLMLPVLS